MRKLLIISGIIVLPFIAIAQDNGKHDDVKVDNKDNKEKGGHKNNEEIKKSQKEMDAEAAKFKRKKYRKLTKGGHKKDDTGDDKKDDKKAKKEEKKNL
ncbi:MAG TPA: hypothetical protein VK783_15935 [Bacteroidia bacterium]|nr:hypothetical protein [Bacteroidia bacterium]